MIDISNAIQTEAEAVCLAKNDLLTTHLKDFDHSLSKAVEKFRELVAALEANDFCQAHMSTMRLLFLRKKNYVKIFVCA